MAEIDTAELRRLHSTATPGEWRETYTYYGAQTRAAVIADGKWIAISSQQKDPNMTLIATAVNALPALLDTVEAQAAEITALRASEPYPHIEEYVDRATHDRALAEISTLRERLLWAGGMLSGNCRACKHYDTQCETEPCMSCENIHGIKMRWELGEHAGGPQPSDELPFVTEPLTEDGKA